MKDLFHKLAHAASEAAGSVWAFTLAAGVILVWAVTGPLFGFSDTWQLVINTGTTVLTFLMVFLIQNTQNREARAIHLKLDELIWRMRGARNAMANIEDLSDEELDRLRQEFQRPDMQSGADAQTAETGPNGFQPPAEIANQPAADRAAHHRRGGTPK